MLNNSRKYYYYYYAYWGHESVLERCFASQIQLKRKRYKQRNQREPSQAEGSLFLRDLTNLNKQENIDDYHEERCYPGTD